MRETRDFTPAEAVSFAKQMCIHGNHRGAAEVCRGVLRVDPTNADAMNQLGVALTETGLSKKTADTARLIDVVKYKIEHKEALEGEAGTFVLEALRNMIERGPDIPAEYYEALYRFERALKVRRRDPVVLSNHGMILCELGHDDEAVDQFRKALHHRPNYAIGHTNLGNTLERLGRYQEALDALNRAISIEPDVALAYYNKAVVLLRLNRHAEALVAQDQALARNPTNEPEVRYNRGVTLLGLGRYQEGFADYESRIQTVGHQPYYVSLKAPRWQGEPLEGKKIIVHSEQGLGDTIQFLRYVRHVRDRNPDKLYLILHRPVHALVRSDLGMDGCEVLEPGAVPPEHDYEVALLSLPHIFGTTLETIPAAWDPTEAGNRCADCAKWGDLIGDGVRNIGNRTIYAPEGVHLRVGVCWSGNWQHKNDSHRSLVLQQFKRMLGVKGIKFYSLQKDVRPMDVEEFKHLDIVDLSAHLTDMRQTAHAIGWLDLVISVDTAVAHMAASMGAETWILVPWFRTDWRWLLHRSDSPWYPSAKLFRQPEYGDWDSVLGQIRRKLERRVAVSAAQAA